MTPEKKKDFSYLVPLMDVLLDDKETLLYAWAKAATDKDFKELDIAEGLKKRGVDMGITEEEFENAYNAMLVTDFLCPPDDEDDESHNLDIVPPES